MFAVFVEQQFSELACNLFGVVENGVWVAGADGAPDELARAGRDAVAGLE